MFYRRPWTEILSGQSIGYITFTQACCCIFNRRKPEPLCHPGVCVCVCVCVCACVCVLGLLFHRMAAESEQSSLCQRSFCYKAQIVLSQAFPSFRECSNLSSVMMSLCLMTVMSCELKPCSGFPKEAKLHAVKNGGPVLTFTRSFLRTLVWI